MNKNARKIVTFRGMSFDLGRRPLESQISRESDFVQKYLLINLDKISKSYKGWLQWRTMLINSIQIIATQGIWQLPVFYGQVLPHSCHDNGSTEHNYIQVRWLNLKSLLYFWFFIKLFTFELRHLKTKLVIGTVI